MPDNLKEIRSRIQFYNSAHQVTKAMKLVSAVKLKKASEAVIKLRPYEKHLNLLFVNLSVRVNHDFRMALTQTRPINKVLVIVISADRGLCGAHNTQIFKVTEQLIQDSYANQYHLGNLFVMPMGKKGITFFKSKGYQLIETPVQLTDVPKFDEIENLSLSIQKKFKDHLYDRIDIVYSQFKNAFKYDYHVHQFLPIKLNQRETTISAFYIFDAPGEQMLTEMIPRYLNSLFFHVALQSKASEHAARMTAMDKATENAKDLLSSLKLSYNRARQAAITKELTEIINGNMT